MKFKLILKSVLFIAITLIFQESKAQEKTNVLFIIVDDWGYHDLSLNGSAMYDSPNVDNLAHSGFVFQNAYAS